MTLVLNHLSFAYDAHSQALKDLNCTIPKGLTGVVGGNGAGKTTLFRILSGEITLSENTMLTLPTHLSLNRRLFLSEHVELPKYLTPLEIWNHIQNESEAQGIYKILNVSEFQSKIIQECSLGMRKRLLLALVLKRAHELTLLDEPFSGIDIDTLFKLKNVFQLHLEKTHGYVIIASHQMDLIELLCSHLLVLERGELRFSGPLPQLLSMTGEKTLMRAYHHLVYSSHP